jgi:arginyl-tRNA synthetase
MVESGAVDAALKTLADSGLLYTGTLEPPKGKLPDDWEPRPQTLFRATQFGDDVDRPVRKSDGSWTYFAADMAYHLDKYRRGSSVMIDVWGADHGGYVKRMQAAVKALTRGKGELDVKLCQLVNLLDKGEPVKMSKRAGNFVTMREVVDEVGKDVFRFIMLTRRNDQTLEFDFTKVTEQSKASTSRRRHWRRRRSIVSPIPPSSRSFACSQAGRGWSKAPPRRTSRTASPFISARWRPAFMGCGTRARRRQACAS